MNGVGLGLIATKGSARVEDCYLDTVPLVVNFTNGGALVVTGNLFLKNASVVMRHGYPKGPPATVDGTRITNNDFHCSDSWPSSQSTISWARSHAHAPARITPTSAGRAHTPMTEPFATTALDGTVRDREPAIKCAASAIIIDESIGKFGAVQNSYIAGNSVDADIGLKSTRAQKRIAVKDSSEVALDFGDSLLFASAPVINGTASCVLFDGEPTAIAVRGVPGEPMKLSVKFAGNWTGVLQCSVDQSASTRAAL